MVTHTTRRSPRSSTARTCGSDSTSSNGPSPGTTTASRVERSHQRRGSPAGSPPSAVASSPTSARARFSSIPCRGRGGALVGSSPIRIRSAVFGPIPGTDSSRPAAAASRNPASVRTPSAFPSSRIRLGESPSRRPTPTSSGIASASSSRSSASSPVSTSSRRRASIPGPIPASSRARPARTSAATSAGVERISSAARRYARTV